MLTETDRAEVARYFGVFNPAPSVTLDGYNDVVESYVLIECGGLSIGMFATDVPCLGGTRLGWKYTVHGSEGEEVSAHSDLASAIKAAMALYAAELFRRVNDSISTEAQAEEYLKEKASG